MTVFLDSNVWLSAIVFPGLCAELLLELDAAGHRPMTSDLVRAEVHDVLRRKFARQATAIDRFDTLWLRARRVADIEDPADDADARLVAAASSAAAQWFVTGDQRVLAWGGRGGMAIVSPRQAWAVLATGAP